MNGAGDEVRVVYTPGGWLEAQTMGIGRRRFLERLDHPRDGKRLRVLYPWSASGEGEDREPIMVHTKLMIIDDCRLHIGSANLANRSMGVDTECDLRIEAESEAHRDAIAGCRRRLLAEHLGIDPDRLATERPTLERELRSREENLLQTAMLERLRESKEIEVNEELVNRFNG